MAKSVGALLLLAVAVCAVATAAGASKMTNLRSKSWMEKAECPKVKPMRSFDIFKIQGAWAFHQYFASSEEALVYRCMLADMTVDAAEDSSVRVSMSFHYRYLDDPDDNVLSGNMTWIVPDLKQPAHWEHAEQPYEGVYNTYVLDTNYKEWLLLLHCAEKKSMPRYLSAIIMSRSSEPPKQQVFAFLKDKLKGYDVPFEFMFPVRQDKCEERASVLKGAASLFGHPGSIKKVGINQKVGI